MTHKKAVLVRCMDSRHWGKFTQALAEVVGPEYVCFDIAIAGGAGIFASLKSEEMTAKILGAVKLAITKGAQEIFLAVHGSCEADMNGCAGYGASGYGSNYDTVEASRDFSINELTNAVEYLRANGVAAPIRIFYITFGPEGEQQIEEVDVGTPVMA